MKNHCLYSWSFLAIAVIILFSPLFYWLTNIGQTAANLPTEATWLPNGTLVSSPKAEALHSLTLPMRIHRLLIYPLLLLTFQFSGSSLALRQRLERWFSAGISRTLFFVLLIEIGLALLYLPFDFYQGFIVAQQFGLSTQSIPDWLNDWGKNMLINLAIEGVAWTGFYGLMLRLPRRWPIPVGALLMFFSAVLVLLTPILITPLFYKVHPLADQNLRARILALANQAQMRVETVEVIDASAKTTTTNAYFTGFGGAQRIVLYDTLLRDYTPAQIEVVLAHELGHWYYQHVLLMVLGAGAAGWLGLFGLQWLLGYVWRGLGLSDPADIAGWPFVLAVIAIVSILVLPIENGISRLAERQADSFALAASHNPSAMVELFEQLAAQNLSPVDAPKWEKFLFFTHPPLVERIGMAKTYQEHH